VLLVLEQMGNEPQTPQTSLSGGQGGIGVPFMTLALSLVTVGGSIGWPFIVSPSNLTYATGAAIEKAALIALLLGSAAALVLAAAAVRRLLQGRWRRSWKTSTLAVVATLTALPGLCLSSLMASAFIYSLLPLTAAELHAIEVAERFVERHGYTSAGHPKDLPVLENDIMDRLAGSEEGLLQMRRGTLKAEAFGVSAVGGGFLVFFESIPPNPIGACRTLEVDEKGYARMLHGDMLPGRYKRVKR
jgi:hypothetical protein